MPAVRRLKLYLASSATLLAAAVATAAVVLSAPVTASEPATLTIVNGPSSISSSGPLTRTLIITSTDADGRLTAPDHGMTVESSDAGSAFSGFYSKSAVGTYSVDVIDHAPYASTASQITVTDTETNATSTIELLAASVASGTSPKS